MTKRTGEIFLDVIQIVEKRNEAKQLGKAHNQISVFEFKTGKEIETGRTGKPTSNRTDFIRPDEHFGPGMGEDGRVLKEYVGHDREALNQRRRSVDRYEPVDYLLD